ncbi:hypothetical protein BD779DRAFT_1676937 [Infundibulicybe gibba]|nr:hypothetical protein BD779DRAFT_1676937 [Infundibulicybe gibba]
MSRSGSPIYTNLSMAKDFDFDLNTQVALTENRIAQDSNLGARLLHHRPPPTPVLIGMLYLGFTHAHSSMSFWYPDNVNRRDRAQQLANDITVLQQSVVEAEADMNKSDARMVPFINEILKNHGLQTFDQLKAKLMASMTPEQKKSYEELVERSRQISDGVDNSLTGTSIVLFFSGITAKSIDIIKFLAAGHVAETFSSYAKAFIILVTKGFEAGKAAFQAAAKSASLAVDILEESSKLANYAARASRVLKIISVVGVIADAFILAFALYAESQQRTALRGAINDLFVRRIISKFYERMCSAIKTQDGLMLSYLLFVTDQKILPEDQAAADKIADKFVKYVTEDWAGITTDACYTLLNDLDASRSSWKNEDPDRASAIQQADQDIGVDNSSVKMFGAENAAKVVRKIFIEASGQPAAATVAVPPPPGMDKLIAHMQQIATSGALNKQKILKLL